MTKICQMLTHLQMPGCLLAGSHFRQAYPLFESIRRPIPLLSAILHRRLAGCSIDQAPWLESLLTQTFAHPCDKAEDQQLCGR